MSRDRRLRIKNDRVLYPLDKKLLSKFEWKDNDIVEQNMIGEQRLLLFNVTKNEELPEVERYVLETYKEIAEEMLENHRKFNEIKKKYKPGSKKYAIALGKLNRGKINYDKINPKLESSFSVKKINGKIKHAEIEIKKLQVHIERLKRLKDEKKK
jgi:hypothetical protein